MKPEETNKPEAKREEHPDRRELVQKLGKFALYAAPFTILAETNKASAATGHGPGRHR